MIGRFFAQQTSSAEDFWSRLLGIDRLKLDSESQIGLEWHNISQENFAWVLALVIVPSVLILAWLVYRKERKDVGAGPKLVLAGLRAALYLIVALMLLGPKLTVEIKKVRKSFILVLVDDSLSMKKADPPTRAEDKLALARITGLVAGDQELPAGIDDTLRKLTRADIVRRVLENPELKILDALEEKLNVAYFTFSKGARAAEDRAKFLESYAPNDAGTETAIGEALTQALSAYKGQLVTAVVIISDGKNNFGVDPAKVARQLRPRLIPVYTLIAGLEHHERDIGLLEPEGREAVLANDTYSFKCSLKSKGYDGEDAEAELFVYEIPDITEELKVEPADLARYLEGLERTAVRAVKLEGADRKQPLEYVWAPKKPGEYLLIVRVSPREDERTDLNNWLHYRVRVADDKIKVLFVDHPPRYEYRYLKNALVRDTKILVHCFLTSADEGFPQEKSLKAEDPVFQEPLKRFPKDLKELLNYDVLVLGDVDLGKLGDPKTVSENLEKFVSNFGGGIVFQSGPMFNPRSFAGTALERLLPVIPEESRTIEMDQVWDRELGYKLTEEAKVEGGHPIVKFPKLAGEIEKIVEQWEDNDQRRDGLHPVRWYSRVAKVKPGARVLVQLTNVPGKETPDSRPPLFVSQNYGYGRIFWSGTDETYLWRYLVGDSPWYYPFWQGVMYWVREGKLLGARRYRLRVDQHTKRYMIGDPIKFFASAFDKDFNPLNEPTIDLQIEPPEGDRITISLNKDKDRDGYYEGQFQPKSVGAYRAWVGEEDESSRATEKFTVFIPNREEDDPVLDEAQMKAIAREAHLKGEEANFFPLTRAGELPGAVRKSDQQLVEIKEDDLWDSPLVYLIFALIITIEWVLRKVFRML